MNTVQRAQLTQRPLDLLGREGDLPADFHGRGPVIDAKNGQVHVNSRKIRSERKILHGGISIYKQGRILSISSGRYNQRTVLLSIWQAPGHPPRPIAARLAWAELLNNTRVS